MPGSSDLTAFQQDVAAATQALDGYQAVTRTMATAADCSAAVNGYGTTMRDDLGRLSSMSGSMDDQMRSMGQQSRADVGCGVQGMQDELQRHLQVACHEADMEHNRAEAAEHVAAMGNALQHMDMRATEVAAGTGHAMGGGMGPGMMDGGWWQLPDGGHMDPDDHPMGCPGGPMMDGGTWDGGPGPMMDGGMGHMP